MTTLAAETVFYIGTFPVTNTLLNTFLVDAILLGMTYYVSKNVSVIPSKFQGTLEMVMEAFYGLTESVAEERTKRIFPYVITFFLFILISNLSGLVPVINRIGFYENGEFIPYLRSASTDLNFTLALALVSLVATHSMSINILGFKTYISRFISLKPLALFTGLLELISEFTKIISFSFRLFGNIYVGEVILGSVSTAGKYAAFLLPIPVIFYELFVSGIQALIFALLTMAFMGILTSPHSEH